MNTTTSFIIRKCAECGEELVMVEETVGTVGSALSPVKKTKYRCTNAACQESLDKKEAERRAVKLQQDLARQRRINNSRSISLKISK